MTQDQIIEFAQEATRYANNQTDAEGYNWDLIRDERFANLVAQYERERLMKEIGVLRSQLLGMRMQFGEGSVVSNLQAALQAEQVVNAAAIRSKT